MNWNTMCRARGTPGQVCMSPCFRHTNFQVLQSPLMSGIMHDRWERHTNCAGLSVLQVKDRFENNCYIKSMSNLQFWFSGKTALSWSCHVINIKGKKYKSFDRSMFLECADALLCFDFSKRLFHIQTGCGSLKWLNLVPVSTLSIINVPL